MGYFIITDKQWAMLRDEIVALAQTCHKAFGESSKHTDWLHNGDVCQLLGISKRTLQHYRDTGMLPFTQIGHKCYYKREDVERLLQTKSEKTKTINKQRKNGISKRFEYGYGRYAGGAVRYQQYEQTDKRSGTDAQASLWR